MSASSSRSKRSQFNRRQKRGQKLLEVSVRRRTATAQRVRRLTYWTCALLLLAGGGVAATYGVREGMKKWVWQNPDLNVASVGITKDGTLSRQEILEASGIREGMNIFTIDLEAARRKVAALSQVERVELQRTLPDKISIHVWERKPVAWVTAKNSDDPSTASDGFLIDRRGVLMRMSHLRPEYLHLPVVTGVPTENLDPGQAIGLPELKTALDLIRLVSASSLQPRFQVRSIDLSKGYCMVVTNESRAKITFGLDRIDEQIDRLGVLLDRVSQSRRELRTINLMVQRNVPVVYAPLDDGSEPETPPPSPAKDGARKNESAKDKKTSATGKASPAPQKSLKTPPVRKAIPVESTTKPNH